MRGASSIHYENSFIMIGGLERVPGTYQSNYLNTMLKYQPETDTWVELAGKMRIGRYAASAIVVDEAIFQVC